MEIWEVAIEADAEVIPGPESQLKQMMEYIKNKYGTEESQDDGWYQRG